MSIEDDVALLERVPTLRLLGTAALRMLAIGSEQRDFVRGDVMFSAGEDADGGFVVQRGSFRIADGIGAEMIAGPGALIGELALVVRDAAAVDRDRGGTFLRDPDLTQPVSARARKRPGGRAPAARRIRQPHQPDRQRH